MKKSDIRQIIREEVINLIRDQYKLTEAFMDPNIRLISKMGGIRNTRWSNFFQKFANTHDIAWDKIPKGAMNKTTNVNDPMIKKGLAFWIINGRKENPFAVDRAYWSSGQIGNEGIDSVVAVTLNNKIQYFGQQRVGAKGIGRSSSAGDAVGLGVRGTLMVKKLHDLADEVYVMDMENYRGGTKELKAKRAELKLGKDTFKDARAWKDANIKRYRDIMNARVGSRDTVDAMVAKIIKIANKAVAEGMELVKTGKYDELQTTVNGNEVPMNNVTSAMSRSLRSYAEYIRYANQAEEDKKSDWGGSYNDKGAKETAGYIKKILNAFESGDANQISRY